MSTSQTVLLSDRFRKIHLHISFSSKSSSAKAFSQSSQSSPQLTSKLFILFPSRCFIALWAKGPIKLIHSKCHQNTWSLCDSGIKSKICFLPPQPSSLQPCPLHQTFSLVPYQSNPERAQPAFHLGTVQSLLYKDEERQYPSGWPPLRSVLESKISASLYSSSLSIQHGWYTAKEVECSFSILFLKFTICSMS